MKKLISIFNIFFLLMSSTVLATLNSGVTPYSGNDYPDKYYNFSTTKTVLVTFQSNFNESYYMSMNVTGIGTHDFTL